MTRTKDRTSSGVQPGGAKDRQRPRQGVAIDPKLAARRQEVARDHDRRRMRLLAVLCAVTLVALGGIVAANSSLLDVDEIRVVGAVNVDSAQVVAASGILIGDPLLDVDVDAARNGVGRLPWVETVSLERHADGTVVLNVSERVPRAALGGPDGLMLIDADGRQLDLVATAPEGFLPIVGIAADGTPGQPAPAEVHPVLRLLEELSPAITPLVSRIEWMDGSLFLALTSGGRAEIGDDTALAEKMVSLETILAKVDLRCLWEIDVRVPTAPAVTRVNANGDPRAAVVDLAECA